MQGSVRLEIIDRRNFMLSAAAAGAISLFVGECLAAGPEAATGAYEAALAKVLGSAKSENDKAITFELPEIAENGNTVPFTIAYEGDMTGKSQVKSFHLIASGNPLPSVAAFHFSPLSGRAAVASRMRLAKTQEVVVIAEMADGRFALAKRTVKVTIGGCGG